VKQDAFPLQIKGLDALSLSRSIERAHVDAFSAYDRGTPHWARPLV